MENTVIMITIGKRSKSEYYHEFFQEKGIKSSFGTFASGTASQEMLDYLGIGNIEKCIIFSFMTMDKSQEILNEINSREMLKKIGEGIAVTVPISKIDSLKSLNTLVGEVSFKEGEGYTMDTENELIVIITNRGYSTEVMEVARGAGAKGGTVIHARGTGTESGEKFFGSLIGAEKEMIFVVAKSDISNDIIKAIKEHNETNKNWEAMVFALPVSDTAGL